MLTGIRGDVGGRVPFSLVAVIALLLAGVSSVYVATTSREAAQADVQLQQLRALREVAEAVHRGVELHAQVLALEAIRIASNGPSNPDRVNREFALLIRDRLVPSFPRTVRGFTLELDRIQAVLLLQSMRTLDLVPSPPQGIPGNRTDESLDTARPAVLAESSRSPYFSLVGSANYTIRRDGVVLRTGFPLRATVNSPFPFLQSVAREFRGAADGSESELSRIVRYILTTAAQFRAIQGFAAREFGEPGTTTFDILSPTDVEVAVNLALLLEQLRRFRNYDERAAIALDAAFYSSFAGRYLGGSLQPDASTRTIVRLLETYANGGTADPADLFALYSAFDADPVRLNRVLAQALSAVVDQHVLRILEYFGVERVIDLGVQVAETLARSIDDFLAWVEGGSREAELVRGFVRELFQMAGEPLTFLGTFAMSLPDREYNATNADGSVHPVSIPAHSAPIEFDAVDFLAGNNDLWLSYYGTLFKKDLKAVHASTREFLMDLATKVANDLNLIGAIPNPTLRGKINPKDSESVLEFVERSLATAVDDAIGRLRNDPSYLGSLVANLWKAHADAVRGVIDFVRANYDTLAAGGDEIAVARTRLAVHLENQAPADPDYWSLDAAGLSDLQAQIQADASGAWVGVAYDRAKQRDSGRLEGIYAAATDASTPPAGGGIYQRLLDTVLGATGFLVRAGDILRAYGTSLVASDDLHNVKLLVPTPRGPFEFWTGNRTAAAAGHGIRQEGVAVRQSPAVLRITRLGDPESWDPATLRVGELWVGLTDPSTVPKGRGSLNVHWTDIHKMSERPFETRWDLRVAGRLHVDAASARGIRFEASGHEREVVSEDVRIDFSLAITVYTGWPLQGVAYRDSNTFAGDVWARILKVLGQFWETILAPIIDRILDEIHAFIEILLDLIRRVMDSEVVRALAEAVRVTVDALQDFALRILGPIAPAVELLVQEVKNGNLSFALLGLNFTLGPGPTLKSVTLKGWKQDAEIWVTFVLRGFKPNEKLSVSNAPVDLLFGFTYYADSYTLTLQGDVLAIVNGQLVSGRAVPKDGGWALEFAIPAIDAYRVETPWFLQLPPIPTPLGTLTIELGVEIRYRVHSSVDWFALLEKTLTEALGAVGGFPGSWEDFGLFLRKFGDRLLKNIADLFISGFIELKEFVLYVEGVFGAGDVAGAGFRIAFVMDGQALIKILKWLIHNLIEFITTFPNPGTDVNYEAFPADLLDDFSVRIEAFGTIGLPRFMARAASDEVPARVRMYVRLQPNLPALLNLWRPEAGTWRVDFGVYLEHIPAPIADAFFHTGSATPDVWLLKGAVVEVAPP